MSLPQLTSGLFAVAAVLASATDVTANGISLYAAASLTAALQEVLPKERFDDLALSVGGSSSLARQIEAGAPADLFFSASSTWMDYLVKQDLIEPETRVDLLGNQLVLIAPRGAAFGVSLRQDFDFAGSFSGRVALADPDHVPAGVYARQSLVSLGWWPALQHRLAPAPHVRAAVVYVERGECTAGFVYRTDLHDAEVELVAAVPDSLHEPIVYTLAAVKGRATEEVLQLSAHLQTRESIAIFRRHGFTPKPID